MSSSDVRSCFFALFLNLAREITSLSETALCDATTVSFFFCLWLSVVVVESPDGVRLTDIRLSKRKLDVELGEEDEGFEG